MKKNNKKRMNLKIYLSEYNNPIALFEKNNIYTPKILITMDVITFECKYHKMVKTTNRLMIITLKTVKVVNSTFSKPIVCISFNVPKTFKAFVNLPVFANLHSAIVVAKKNIIDMINPSIGMIHNCKITPKKKDNNVGTIK